MSALRLLVTVGVAAAVAVLGAGVAEHRPAPAARPAAAPGVAAAPAPSPAVGPERASIPPGILSRAADARALDRGACAATDRGGACAPPSGPVEIDWDVRPEP